MAGVALAPGGVVYASAAPGGHDRQDHGVDPGTAGFRGKLVGSRETFSPKGFNGALMKCQDAELLRLAAVRARSSAPMRIPICVWADHSIVTAVAVVDSPQTRRRAPGITRAEFADLATTVHNTMRSKYWDGVCTWHHCNGKVNETPDD
ncbi:hypothetical protein [Streptomyces sp. NPDC127084]|uniref:hypothetical protein n=1 Tax=Streptomyces sp. NPDC127084 TaxID=3347133 RepID=UPI003655BD61